MSTSPFDVNKPTTPTTWRDELCAIPYVLVALVYVCCGSVSHLIGGRK